MKLAWMVVGVTLATGSAARADKVDPATATDPAPAAEAAPTAPAPQSTLAPEGAPAPVAPPTAPAAKPGPRITVMWAPLRLIVPLGEITVEYRVMDKLGVSVELGGGKRTLTTGMTDVPGTEIEGGAQVRYYVLGNFRKGMELGAEILDEYVKFKEPLPAGVVGVAAGGVTAGPFVGYKVATHIGFTFEAQVGARYLVVDPAVTGQGMPMISSRWEPLLHINFGWSF